MKTYINTCGGNYNNFNEVINDLKNTNNSVLVKGMPNYRAALIKNDGVYELRVFFVGKNFNSYMHRTFEIGQRLTANAINKIETIMDYYVDNYYEPIESKAMACNNFNV